MTHDPLNPHSHDPNPEPPTADPTITLTFPDGRSQSITIAALKALPPLSLTNCYIVSTGHGTSGPFTFSGTALHTLVEAQAHSLEDYSEIEVISADGFGTRVSKTELEKQSQLPRPILLAWNMDGRPLTRQEGTVRLIVPGETDDALRQVKWIGQINIR